MKEFGLTLEQTRIMFSYQYHLTLGDIEYDFFFDKKVLKREWLSKWQDSTELFLNIQINKNSTTNYTFGLLADFSLLKKEVEIIRKELDSKFTLMVILLEVTLFTPYYPLGDNEQQFRDLKIYDENKLIGMLEFFAGTLEIDTNCVKKFKTAYNQAVDGISGRTFNLLLGGLFGTIFLAVIAAFATPLIAGLLAPILVPGLSGAAAVSAVLAFLGGGAIAAGGFGMAGGLAVIVGGGAILGAGAGAGVGSLFAQCPDTALTQAAKLEVVLREIILVQKDIRFAQEIIKEQRNAIRSLEDKMFELRRNQEKNKAEIENLKKAIEYLNKALERNEILLF